MIPKNFEDRLSWMVDQYKMNENKFKSILNTRDEMINTLKYDDLNIILYEIPEGSPRPRFRIINRSNFANAALANSAFVHVYSRDAEQDSAHMKRLKEDELNNIINNTNELLNTPCIIDYIVFHKTPSNFNIDETFLAEMGIIRPLNKPDWDNIGKKYSDMSNENIWLDDSFVIDGRVQRFYSVLPRVEINIRYLNMVYTKKQYDSISKRKDFNKYNLSLEYFKKGMRDKNV